MNRKTRTLLIWLALSAICVLALSQVNKSGSVSRASTRQVLDSIDAGEIASYRLDGQRLILSMRDGGQLAVDLPNQEVTSRLVESGAIFDPVVRDSGSNTLWLVLISAAIGVVLLLLLAKKFGGGGVQSIFQLRKSTARAIEDANKAHFVDIGGNRQAVELMADLVDFLREPAPWLAAGLRIPRGILLVGPPGTGKTLLARAVAGETNASFFYLSASEFVEMFVGVGAARVRDTFEQALAKQPAIVFIDELDAVGRRRGSGIGTMHEEREQTLNQLLVLLDGVEQKKRLVVIAATNRPDILDPALLRPGRFDRTVRIELPSAAERRDILGIHTRNKPLDIQFSFDRVVQQTEGFSGADLETLTNSAGLLAVRRARKDGGPVSITNDDFDRARMEMTKSSRSFDRLDTVLVESVSQFAEPVGRAVTRVTLLNGVIVDGEVMWMNATHVKLKMVDGSELILAKQNIVQMAPLAGTEQSASADFVPDRWAERSLDVG